MSELLHLARDAHARRDWPMAVSLFREAEAAGPLLPDDLYAWSDAAWWLGDNEQMFAAAERAYAAYLDCDQPRRAAVAATDIAAAHFLAGDGTVASGWIGRAQRLLAHEPDSAERGYLVYLLEVEGPLGGIAPSEAAAVEELIGSARRVQEIGRRHGDRTLVALGTLGEGRARVKAGEVDHGLPLLDEAMLAALGDELVPAWAGNLFCQLIEAAEELGDYPRARRWTAAMTEWLERMPAAVVFGGICGVHRSRVFQLAGAWDRAEQEASQVCAELGGLHVAAAAKAHYQVGEIRRHRGDLAGAETAYERARELGRDPQPGLALLRLAQGRAEVAAAALSAALLGEPGAFRRAELRAAQVEVVLARGEPERAREAVAELEDAAARFGSCGLQLAARRARGAILLAEDRAAEALPLLRDACAGWSDVDAPYECARIRILLCETYRRLGDFETAERELEVAIAGFERLGAERDLAAATRLRRETRPGGLTPREAEVLALVATGHTNKRIGRELAVSEKTVARHLANIFAKLNVSSRTAAAAFAHRHLPAQPGRAAGPGPG
jgi:DNA-binding NarL/FixJ family response regulator